MELIFTSTNIMNLTRKKISDKECFNHICCLRESEFSIICSWPHINHDKWLSTANDICIQILPSLCAHTPNKSTLNHHHVHITEPFDQNGLILRTIAQERLLEMLPDQPIPKILPSYSQMSIIPHIQICRNTYSGWIQISFTSTWCTYFTSSFH